jgi:ubiquinone/menaquinone biosynthesis C-methylase UbiE
MLETKLSNKHFSKVLEVGAGSGEHLEFINHGFETLVISDLTLPIPPGHILDKVKQHTDNGRIIEFKSENVENLSYSNSEFDRVIATCLLHHVEKPHDALLEIRRVTKNGG